MVTKKIWENSHKKGELKYMKSEDDLKRKNYLQFSKPNYFQQNSTQITRSPFPHQISGIKGMDLDPL